MLRLKSAIVGTWLERPAIKAQRALGSRVRRRFPELCELHLSERQLPTVLQRLLRSDSCGVDVGAHIGSFLSQLTHISPQGKHVAIEPISKKAEWLANKFPVARVICAAASETSGQIKFSEDLVRPGYSKVSDKQSDGHTRCYEVKAVRLDDVIGPERVDLLKLDVEGHELSVLRGATLLIGSKRPAIIFECGPTAGGQRQPIFEFLNQTLSYEIYTFSDFLFDRGAMQFDEFRRCGIYPFRSFNYLALPQ